MKSAEEEIIRKIIREQLSVYGSQRLGNTLGGFGKMFKLGVDYKNASSNIPQVRVGSVARFPKIPVKVAILSSGDSKDLYEKLFRNGFKSDRVNLEVDKYVADDGDLLIYGHAITGDGVKAEVPSLLLKDVQKAVGYYFRKDPDADYKVYAELIN